MLIHISKRGPVIRDSDRDSYLLNLCFVSIQYDMIYLKIDRTE